MLSEQFTCNTNFYFLVIYNIILSCLKLVKIFWLLQNFLYITFLNLICKLASYSNLSSVPNMMSEEEAVTLPSHPTGSSSISNPNSNSVKRKRSLPGTPGTYTYIIVQIHVLLLRLLIQASLLKSI